jgi:hypothetical protein
MLYHKKLSKEDVIKLMMIAYNIGTTRSNNVNKNINFDYNNSVTEFFSKLHDNVSQCDLETGKPISNNQKPKY